MAGRPPLLIVRQIDGITGEGKGDERNSEFNNLEHNDVCVVVLLLISATVAAFIYYTRNKFPGFTKKKSAVCKKKYGVCQCGRQLLMNQVTNGN